MILSPSQLSRAKACRRQWWFDSVRKMPSGPRPQSQVFGDVLHAVVERWLRAGPDGRDEQGREVDLYPLGWQWAFDRGGGWARIEPEDEEIVKRLVEKAILEGHIERAPGRQIERPLVVSIVGGPFPIVSSGRADVLIPPDTIVDHKTKSNMRYACSERPGTLSYLGDDDQMLAYAYVLAQENPDQQTFTLKHIYYDTTNVEVQTRQVTVTRAEVEQRWAEMKELAESLRPLVDIPEHEWRSVPGAMDSEETWSRCAKPFKCRYIDTCAGLESPEKFRRRYLRLALPQLFETQEENVGLAEKLAALEAKLASAGPATPGPELTDKPALEVLEEIAGPSSAPAPDTTPEVGAAPSTEATTENTTGSGSEKKRRGRPKKAVDTGEKSVAQAGSQAVLDLLQSQILPEDVPQGPTLLHGCSLVAQRVTVGGKRRDVAQAGLSDVLRVAVEEIGGSALEDFYKADAFKRRDAFGQIGKQIAERFAGVFVLAPVRPTPDEAALLAAISPYSSLEIGARA